MPRKKKQAAKPQNASKGGRVRKEPDSACASSGKQKKQKTGGQAPPPAPLPSSSEALRDPGPVQTHGRVAREQPVPRETGLVPRPADNAPPGALALVETARRTQELRKEIEQPVEEESETGSAQEWARAKTGLHIMWCVVLLALCYFSTQFSVRAFLAACLAHKVFLYTDNSFLGNTDRWGDCFNMDSVFLVYALTAEVQYYWSFNHGQWVEVAGAWYNWLLCAKTTIVCINLVIWKKFARYSMSFRELVVWIFLVFTVCIPALNTTNGTQCYVVALENASQCDALFGRGMEITHGPSEPKAFSGKLIKIQKTVGIIKITTPAYTGKLKPGVKANQTNVINATRDAHGGVVKHVDAEVIPFKGMTLVPFKVITTRKRKQYPNTKSAGDSENPPGSATTKPAFHLCWMDKLVCALSARYAVILFFVGAFALVFAVLFFTLTYWRVKTGAALGGELRGSEELYHDFCGMCKNALGVAQWLLGKVLQ